MYKLSIGSLKNSIRGRFAADSLRFPSNLKTLAAIILVASSCASAQTLTTIYNFGFGPADGANPQAGLVLDNSGILFGTTALGGTPRSNGTAFRLKLGAGGGWNEKVLHRFQGPKDGSQPLGRLTVTSSGKVFGTASAGGTNGKGTAFVLTPPAVPGGPWTTKVLYNFGGSATDGASPNARLLAANPGFYGVTRDGGSNGAGTVFQLKAAAGSSWTETVLYSFGFAPDAAFPAGELVADKNGNLYGTTTLGGINNQGAVYQLAPPPITGGPWTETVIYSFNGTDGTLPGGGLQFDAKGKLSGTTNGGGAQSGGTVFQLTPPAIKGNPWTQAVLFDFSGGSLDGGSPSAGVIFYKGSLFGTASSGGAGGAGAVFQLAPPVGGHGPWTETILHSFTSRDGFAPRSQLVQKNGIFYGTTSQGGVFGTGTVFALLP